jgi:hypothetical protein
MTSHEGTGSIIRAIEMRRFRSYVGNIPLSNGDDFTIGKNVQGECWVLLEGAGEIEVPWMLHYHRAPGDDGVGDIRRDINDWKFEQPYELYPAKDGTQRWQRIGRWQQKTYPGMQAIDFHFVQQTPDPIVGLTAEVSWCGVP